MTIDPNQLSENIAHSGVPYCYRQKKKLQRQKEGRQAERERQRRVPGSKCSRQAVAKAGKSAGSYSSMAHASSASPCLSLFFSFLQAAASFTSPPKTQVLHCFTLSPTPPAHPQHAEPDHVTLPTCSTQAMPTMPPVPVATAMPS